MPVFIGVAEKIGLKAVLITDAGIAAVGTALLAFFAPTTSYLGAVLPGLMVMGVGMAGVFAAARNLALLGVDSADAGAASAASSATSQVGGAVGLAILTNAYMSLGPGSGVAATLGYSGVFAGAACALALVAVLSRSW